MSTTQQTGPEKELAERVIAIICKSAEKPEENITLETTLEELGFDSVDAVSMTFDIEDEFGIEIADQGFIGVKNIGQIVEMLEKIMVPPA
ncbi:MAG: acyl carrier protein [Methylococcaceae bacterium]|jgi:acyl carrier protein